MKNAIFLLSLLLLIGCVVHRTETIPVSTIVVESPMAVQDVDQVWLLEITDEGSGSCFPVKCEIEAAGRLGEDAYLVWFLTTEHCIRGITTRDCISVSDERETTLDEMIRIESAPGLDLAVIVFWSPVQIKVRTLSFVPVRSGEWLVASGYVNGEIAMPTLGLAGRSGSSSCHGYFGCSGGPITRLDGLVVGVQSMILWDEVSNFPITFCSFYVPIVEAEDWIRQWLE